MIKDKATGTIFDDAVEQDKNEGYDTTHWTSVCGKCAKKNKLPKKGLSEGEGTGICGVLGCDMDCSEDENASYYDFNGVEI